jgi:hypothetical protein
MCVTGHVCDMCVANVLLARDMCVHGDTGLTAMDGVFGDESAAVSAILHGPRAWV